MTQLRERQSWAVIVERNGEEVVTLSSNGYGGRDLSDDDERIVRRAAEHLLSFLGQTHTRPDNQHIPRLTERDANIICGVIVGSRLDFEEKERLCAEVRRFEGEPQ